MGGTEIVPCTTCGTKNRLIEGWVGTAFCGKCGGALPVAPRLAIPISPGPTTPPPASSPVAGSDPAAPKPIPANSNQPARPADPVPAADRPEPQKRASWLPVILCVLALAGVLGIIYAMQVKPDSFSTVFEREVQSSQGAAPATAAPLDTSGLTQIQPKPADDWVDVPSEQTAPAPAAATTAQPPNPERYPWDRITIDATTDAWIMVARPDGTQLFSKVLKKGEGYVVPEEPGLTLDTGNAGGIIIAINGKPQPPIGAAGEVKRKVQLRSSNPFDRFDPAKTEVGKTGQVKTGQAADAAKLPEGVLKIQPVKPGIIMATSKAERIAPFQIRTKAGANYYVKLVNATTDAPVLGIYVAGGRTLDVDVPLGTYRMRYAFGDTWFGLEHLFGPDTDYAKADRIFDFKVQGSQVSGYTVELIPQTNGNLQTRKIPAAEF